MDIGSIILMLAVLIALARLGSLLFQRFGLSGLIGEILIGIILANLVIGDWSIMNLLDVIMPDREAGIEDGSLNYEVVEIFAELGAIFLLFGVGLETRVRNLLSVGRAAMFVAVLGVILPFLFGFALIQVYDGNVNHAMFLGAAMVATSVGITARVIKEMNVLHTLESRIIIAAAVIDDILGMIILAIVVGAARTGNMAIGDVAMVAGIAVAFVLVIMAIAMWVVPEIYDYFVKRKMHKVHEEHKDLEAEESRKEDHLGKLIMAAVVCLGVAWFADSIGLAAIIGAFLGGMLLADYALEWGLEEKFEPITLFFLSFFFLNVGMQVKIEDCMNPAVLGLAAVVIVLAVVSKYIGCGVGARLGDKTLDKLSSKVIGIGMIPRGEVGIIVAAIGLASDAMSSELYAVVVIMAVATTVISPPLLVRAFKKRYPDGCPDGEECYIKQ
ncbi:MAG: cation:proton antiporter [Candidatus Methanoplasma sp.]|jgi:Kef-type K+ transport system membrane component KefB|nr:cation:proton antiporter [Candidatus Methanoplasma sp.]